MYVINRSRAKTSLVKSTRNYLCSIARRNERHLKHFDLRVQCPYHKQSLPAREQVIILASFVVVTWLNNRQGCIALKKMLNSPAIGSPLASTASIRPYRSLAKAVAPTGVRPFLIGVLQRPFHAHRTPTYLLNRNTTEELDRLKTIHAVTRKKV